MLSDTTDASFGTLLRLHRRRAGLTQEGLGEHAGYSGDYIKKLEAGDRRPSEASMEVLAEALELDAESRQRFRMARTSGGPAAPAFVDDAPHRLPADVSSFIPRQKELAEIKNLVSSHSVRLVTLTGPGGTGKTRLAMEVGRALSSEFPDGVFVAELGSVTRPEQVVPVIRASMDAPEGAGDLDTIATWLDDKRALLVVDNFEHVVDAAQDILELLGACPNLTALLTSRVPLRSAGEHVYYVPPMNLPQKGADPRSAAALDSEAVRLFAARSAEANTGFAVTPDNADLVVAICRRLEGIPLAIELAAGNLKMFRPRQLLARLELDGITSGVGHSTAATFPERHRSLRKTIEWSYGLLSEEAQATLQRAAVFRRGFTFEGLEAVSGCGTADTVTSLEELLDGSLVREEEGCEGESRYSMLETIREVATSKLTADERRRAERSHAEYFLQMAQDLYPDLNGSRRSAAVNRLEAEHDNLTMAIGWFTSHANRAAASRMAGLVWPLWYDRGFRSQGRQTLAMVIAPDGRDEPGDIRALRGAAVLSMQAGQFEEAEALLFRAANLARSSNETVELAHTLRGLSGLAELRDDADGMTRYAREVLDIALRMHDVGMSARAASDLAVGLLAQGRCDEAVPYIEQSIEAARQSGLRDLLILGLGNLGWVRQKEGRQSDAETLARESYRIATAEGGAWPRGVSALSLGGIIAFTSPVEALGYLYEALASFQELDDAEDQLFSCELVALCLSLSGQELQSAVVWGATDTLRTSMRLPGLSDNRTYWQVELERARGRVPPSDWDQQWIRGSDMTLETLVRLALDLSSGS